MTSRERAQRALDYRESGMVQRAHTVPHHGEYTVATHSWNMATLLIALHPCPSANLLRAVLTHDCAERWTGDTPAPMKRMFPELCGMLHQAEDAVMAKRFHGGPLGLEPAEVRWVKALDCLEFFLWCSDQINMGNRHAQTSFENICGYLDDMELPENVRDFYENFQWRRGKDEP